MLIHQTRTNAINHNFNHGFVAHLTAGVNCRFDYTPDICVNNLNDFPTFHFCEKSILLAWLRPMDRFTKMNSISSGLLKICHMTQAKSAFMIFPIYRIGITIG